jgi:hypothetical protein
VIVADGLIENLVCLFSKSHLYDSSMLCFKLQIYTIFLKLPTFFYYFKYFIPKMVGSSKKKPYICRQIILY